MLAQANEQGAQLYVGLRLVATTDETRVAFYAQRNWESVGGHRLADLIQERAGNRNGSHS